MQWAGVTASWPRLSWDSCLPGHHRGPRPGVATSKGSRFCSGHGLIRTCEAGGRSSPRPRRPCTAPPAPRATAPAPWDHVPLVPTLHRQAPLRGPAGTLLPPRAWRALRLPARQPRPAGRRSPGSPFTCPLCLLRRWPHLLWSSHHTPGGGGWVRAGLLGGWGQGYTGGARVGGKAQPPGRLRALLGDPAPGACPMALPAPRGTLPGLLCCDRCPHALNCLAGPVSPRPPCRRFQEVSWLATQFSQHKETWYS